MYNEQYGYNGILVFVLESIKHTNAIRIVSKESSHAQGGGDYSTRALIVKVSSLLRSVVRVGMVIRYCAVN